MVDPSRSDEAATGMMLVRSKQRHDRNGVLVVTVGINPETVDRISSAGRLEEHR